MIRLILAVALTASLTLAASAREPAAPIVGRASVIDGDTIEIRGQRIRLFGIDAPEGRQTCTDAKGAAYRCGQKAAQALDYRISDGVVTCEPKDRDRYGRIRGVPGLRGGLVGLDGGARVGARLPPLQHAICAGRGIGRAPQGRDVEWSVRAAVGVASWRSRERQRAVLRRSR
jgi:hypothetical protein